MRRVDPRVVLTAAMAVGVFANAAGAAELKVLHAGASTELVQAVVPEFEKQSGHKVERKRDTVGALTKLIEGGEPFDLCVLTTAAIDELIKKGKVAAGSRTDLVKVGVGVVVKEGAPRPDISTVEAFKQAVLNASSVAYIDPGAGGSSGIYVAQLLERLGVADALQSKTVLVPGGAVAEYVARGEAELGIHQISEILPVKGTVLVGPLPKEIQNYTVYAAGISASARD